MSKEFIAETAPHKVPSASPHVRLSLVNIAGPAYTPMRSDRLRISLNIGPPFSAETSGDQGRGSLSCQRNGLLVTPPDLAPNYRATAPVGIERPLKPVRLVVFAISQELLAACFIERGMKRSEAAFAHQAIASNSALLSLAQALLADLSEGSPDGPQETECLAKALVARVARHLNDGPTPTPAEDPLARVRRHIEANLPSALTLGALAEMAGMSQFHFCRLFRDATGQSPHQYVLKARVDAACRLLWNCGTAGSGPRTVLDIALACGFGSSSHFSTQFKRHTGQSPLTWKSAHR